MKQPDTSSHISELGAENVVTPTVLSPWQPLHNRTFRVLWIATVASNIGSWMHDLGASWMMTSLSADPLMVAMVQAAASLPMFLFMLPSGVLTDVVDRRTYLLFAQTWMLLAAGALGVLTLLDLVTPVVLLATTCLLSVGGAMSAPPLQAIVPDLVKPKDLAAAVSLNSLGINVSRAVGPALGGVILSFFGFAAVFFLNSLSVVGVLIVLWRWRREPVVRRLPPEHFLPAIRSGLRYAKSAPLLRTVLVRAASFFIFGSASWSLLPVIARQELGLGPSGYGGLLASIGVGAIVGALLLPTLRAKLSPDALTVYASVLFGLTMLCLGLIRTTWLLATLLPFAGLAWIIVLSTLSLSAQRSAANWVRGRALAVYLTVFYGAMAAGSTIWGATASSIDTATAMVAAGIGMMLSCASAFWWRLGISPSLDLGPSTYMGNLNISPDPAPDDGPVMIIVEYQIAPEKTAEFRLAIEEMRNVRRRGGALSWSVFRDSEDLARFIETFVVESWIEHLRQHERFTNHDMQIIDRVNQFHTGPDRPRVRHMISPG